MGTIFFFTIFGLNRPGIPHYSESFRLMRCFKRENVPSSLSLVCFFSSRGKKRENQNDVAKKKIMSFFVFVVVVVVIADFHGNDRAERTVRKRIGAKNKYRNK